MTEAARASRFQKQSKRCFPHLQRPVLALLIALLFWPQGAEEQGREFSRVRPLNRFETGQPRGAEKNGFHFMATAIGDDYFDGTSPPSRLKRHLAVVRRAGVKYLRCAFSWDAIEKKQGQYDWTFWDTLVELAGQNGVQLLPYVAYTPEWAARDTKEFWKQPPRNAQLYGDFMYTIAARYRGRIQSWEIWNEPDNIDYWTGTADEFASLVELAARRIRDADPKAVLILGGMAYGPGDFFQHLMAKYQIDEYVDVIAMHAYPESWTNERAEAVFQQWVPRMVEMIRNDNSGDGFWVNEMGYADYRFRRNQASVYGTQIYYRYEHTRRYQAAMLFKFEVMALASEQVGLTGWYRIDDFPPGEKRLGSDLVNYHLGLADACGRPKPAFFALRFFNRLFGKPIKVFQPRILVPASSQAVVDVFLRSDHKVLVIGWLRSSHNDEIPQLTGMLRDQRVERVSVGLPCKELRWVGYYDQLGHREGVRPRLRPGSLEGIRLRGDRVLIAELSCTAKRRLRKERTPHGVPVARLRADY